MRVGQTGWGMREEGGARRIEVEEGDSREGREGKIRVAGGERKKRSDWLRERQSGVVG